MNAAVAPSVSPANMRVRPRARVDSAMPCFRLGALGTELERHKRVNGLVSCVFADEESGDTKAAYQQRTSPCPPSRC